MDIFKWADEYMWLADYQDLHTGMIYHITDAPDHDHIPVSLDGKLIHTVIRDKEED